MGGNALGFETVRLNSDDYYILVSSIENLISEAKVIPSYRTKPDFGDMDLLYKKGSISTDEIRERLQTVYTLNGEYRNGDVTSLGIVLDGGIFQLDFIAAPESSYDFAYNYFSYNDMGNLMGRVARSSGLKFGHNGLFYVQREGDYVLKEHLLTNKFDTALYHLGFDADRFYEGFDTLEDIFDFVMSSPFYDFNKFDLTQRNHRSRVRDQKRPNYRAFLEYAKENPISNIMFRPDLYLSYHLETFPEFKTDYYAMIEHAAQTKLYKAKINGEIVMNLTGLSGKALGIFMTDIKDSMSMNEVIEANQDYINDKILTLFRNK